MEPHDANGLQLDDNVRRAHADTAELEIDHTMLGQDGKSRFLIFDNHAHMGSYEAVLANPAYNLDISQTRSYSSKYGAAINIEQSLNGWSGAFLRLGWNNAQTETWAFTEIDRSAAVGLSFTGRPWHRADDTLGIAALVNGLSHEHAEYLAAGGYGFIIGDGRLDYAPEEIAEMYYSGQVSRGLSLSLDVQYVQNPAYNKDRGPVPIVAMRGHVDL
jgi:high affinity Mn2+ porin